MLYFTRTKLGFTEAEFWKFSLKKYILLRDIYLEENMNPEDREVFADDVL
jgi:hypothetical protein